MKIKLDAEGNVVLDEHGNPVMVDDDGKDIPTFSSDYVKQLRDEAKNYRLEKNKFKEEMDSLKAKFDSIDLEEIEKIRKDKDEYEKKQLEDGKNFTALKDRLLSEHKKEVERQLTEKEDLMKKLNQLEAEYHNTLIMTEVQRAANEAEAFSPMDLFYRLSKSAKVVVTENGEKVVQIFEGEHAVVDGTGKPIGIKNKVNEMKSDKETAHLFKGGNYGVNSHTTNGVVKPGENPWKTGNLKAQAAIYTSDPTYARKLANEAGSEIME
jgi:hypothetical protein